MYMSCFVSITYQTEDAGPEGMDVSSALFSVKSYTNINSNNNNNSNTNIELKNDCEAMLLQSRPRIKR